MPTLRRAVLLIMLLAVSGCSRGMEVGSPSPAETYSVSVRNLTGVTMVVSYDDGRGDAILGTVGSNSTERFVIAAPAVRSVTVSGAAATGSRRSGPYTVNLIAGSTQTVTLR
jgi:hypothetical protein